MPTPPMPVLALVLPLLLPLPLLALLKAKGVPDDKELDANDEDDTLESPIASLKCFSLGMHPKMVLNVESVR
jgi:hypothetical protein